MQEAGRLRLAVIEDNSRQSGFKQGYIVLAKRFIGYIASRLLKICKPDALRHSFEIALPLSTIPFCNSSALRDISLSSLKSLRFLCPITQTLRSAGISPQDASVFERLAKLSPDELARAGAAEASKSAAAERRLSIRMQGENFNAHLQMGPIRGADPGRVPCRWAPAPLFRPRRAFIKIQR